MNNQIIRYCAWYGDKKPGEIEKQLVESITKIKYTSLLPGGLVLEFKETQCWDNWYLYLGNDCIFHVQEIENGFSIIHSERALLEKIFISDPVA